MADLPRKPSTKLKGGHKKAPTQAPRSIDKNSSASKTPGDMKQATRRGHARPGIGGSRKGF